MMEAPVKPHESDCCNSGCNPCILDFYEIQLKKFQRSPKKGPSNAFSNAINGTSYTKYVLKSRAEVSPGILALEFAYSDAKQPQPSCLRFASGQHFLLRLKDASGEFTRAYSPLQLPQVCFKVIIKLYNNGRASRIIRNLEIGAVTEWRGPYGDFTLNYNTKYFVFIAQGTGILPIYSIIREILDNEECESFIKLFYCCRSEEILFRDELYAFCSYWNFSCELFLSSGEIEGKYNEILRFRKLGIKDLESYVCGKSGVRGIVCGSSDFSGCFRSQLENLVEMKSNIFVL